VSELIAIAHALATIDAELVKRALDQGVTILGKATCEVSCSIKYELTSELLSRSRVHHVVLRAGTEPSRRRLQHRRFQFRLWGAHWRRPSRHGHGRGSRWKRPHCGCAPRRGD
jgi:hypothetical protein